MSKLALCNIVFCCVSFFSCCDAMDIDVRDKYLDSTISRCKSVDANEEHLVSTISRCKSMESTFRCSISAQVSNFVQKFMEKEEMEGEVLSIIKSPVIFGDKRMFDVTIRLNDSSERSYTVELVNRFLINVIVGAKEWGTLAKDKESELDRIGLEIVVPTHFAILKKYGIGNIYKIADFDEEIYSRNALSIYSRLDLGGDGPIGRQISPVDTGLLTIREKAQGKPLGEIYSAYTKPQLLEIFYPLGRCIAEFHEMSAVKNSPRQLRFNHGNINGHNLFLDLENSKFTLTDFFPVKKGSREDDVFLLLKNILLQHICLDSLDREETITAVNNLMRGYYSAASRQNQSEILSFEFFNWYFFSYGDKVSLKDAQYSVFEDLLDVLENPLKKGML